MTDAALGRKGSVWFIEIRRREQANALRRRTIQEIETLLDAAEAAYLKPSPTSTAGAGGVVVTGSPDCFSAGADLSEFTGALDDLGFDEEMERLCHRLARSPLPVVAAVEGACFGAAVDLAWACDAVVVSRSARLALPSTRLGILYNPVSVARLHARLGSSAVRRLMVLQQELTGQDLPSGSAMVAEPGTTVERAEQLLESLSASQRATAATKAVLACLDSGAGFDPASWQVEREALLTSPERWEALEASKKRVRKEQS